MPSVELDPDEMLVLFELVSRFTNDDVLEIRDPAEQAALWNLTAALERVLSEPLTKDYATLLESARARVAAASGLSRPS